jgi:hypothetical protein
MNVGGLIPMRRILRGEDAQSILAKTPPWKSLRLPGWESMTPKAATLLADRPGNLHLPDLISLPSAVATQLGLLHSRKHGMPTDPASPDHDPDTLEYTFHGYWLGLPRVLRLSTQAARGLAQHVGSLTLSGKLALTAAAAHELARYRGSGLTFEGYTCFPAQVLRELAQYGGPLRLDGIKALSPEQAAALSKCRGFPSLRGIRSLTVPVARELAQIPEEVELCGVERISDDVAKIFGLAQCRVVLSGLKHCTERQYQLLAAKRSPQVPYQFFDKFDRTP